MKIKTLGSIIMIIISLNGLAQKKINNPNQFSSNEKYQIKPIPLQSRWADKVDPNNALSEYPRPQLQRENWVNLNGIWEYAITDSLITSPTTFDGKILVPFPIESALSGVQRALLPNEYLWYKKNIKCPNFANGENIILNFGAIDWQATVYINNKQVGQHTGGYQNFSYNITKFLKPGENEIRVKVYDPTDRGSNPHGKQVLKADNMYYTSSSGIWQTVWLEKVSTAHIVNLKSTPNIDKGILDLNLSMTGIKGDASLEVIVSSKNKIISTQKKSISLSKDARNFQVEKIVLNIPDERLWSPDDPHLYDMSIKLIQGNKTVDKVTSYFGMRKVNIQKDEKGTDRIFINNIPTYNLGTLDQGYWPDGLYTAPTDEALSFDIRAIKAMGFNTIRKHIKIEPERWYYYADKIGVLVWQDFVNPPHNLPKGSKSIFEKEVIETIEQLHNHPSIVTWVLFNERWGAYDQERLAKLIRINDPSRLINSHSGELLYVNDRLREPATNPWIGSDMTDVHSYPDPRIVPGQPNKAKVIGEFGGIGVSVAGHEWNDLQGWGYIKVNASDFKNQYSHMMEKLKKLKADGLSGSIYTQPFDVEGEENGLITYDREQIKIPVAEIRTINETLVSQTIAFDIDPSFYITEVDPNDNDSRYEEFMSEYQNGKRDSAFLRRLTLIANRKNYLDTASIVGNDYFKSLKSPLSKANLTFLLNITRSSSDSSFRLLLTQSRKVDSILGAATSSDKVKKIINIEEIAPYYNHNPDWKNILQKVSTKYGKIGEEYVLGRMMIYYGVEKKDWKNFAQYYKLYFEKTLTHNPEYIINTVTWILYENVDDSEILNFAANVMKYTIEKWDNSPQAYDTYANLLHKTNKSSQAIEWEEKALKLGKGTPDEKLFAETLQKMKSGLPTWPQTQNN